jgi:hypothetical protein
MLITQESISDAPLSPDPRNLYKKPPKDAKIAQVRVLSESGVPKNQHVSSRVPDQAPMLEAKTLSRITTHQQPPPRSHLQEFTDVRYGRGSSMSEHTKTVGIEKASECDYS